MSYEIEALPSKSSLGIKKLLLVAGKVAVTIGCFWYVLRQIDLRQALSAVPLLDLRWAVLGVSIVVLQIPLVALRWRLILSALTTVSAGISRAAIVAVTAIAVFFAQVLPSAASEGVRAWLVVRLGCDWRHALTSVLIDRAVGVGLLVAIGFAILLWPSDLVALGGYRNVLLTVYGVLLVAGVLGLLLVPKIVPLLARFRYSRWIAALAADAHAVLLGRNSPAILGLGCLIHALTVAVIWSLAQAQGLPLGFVGAAALFTVMIGVAIVPVSISGWGLRELAVVQILAGQGISPEQALLFSVCFGLTLAIGSLPGAVTWLLYPVTPSARVIEAAR